MIFSVEQTFSDAQVVATNGPSTNTIDLGETGTVLKGPAPLVRDIGKGNPIPIVIQLVEDAADPGDTLQVTLQVDDNSSFSSETDVAQSVALTGGVAGDQLSVFYVPQGTNERYFRLNYAVTGTAPSYTITAGIVLADQSADGLAGV